LGVAAPSPQTSTHTFFALSRFLSILSVPVMWRSGRCSLPSSGLYSPGMALPTNEGQVRSTWCRASSMCWIDSCTPAVLFAARARAASRRSVFVGGGDCYRVLRREPMLSSRVYVWQEFRRMTREQVLDIIPVYHPVWAGTDPELLAYADTHAGHGNFRAWSKLTAHIITGLTRLDRPTPRPRRAAMGVLPARRP
jgi:hypothetical protein